MKALIFALTILLGFDVVMDHGAHTRSLWMHLGAFAQGIGAWVFYSG